MAGHHLIVCGVPGAGKSTLAHRAVDRWGAVSFASETFADELGAAGRTSSGDLTKQAIVHAYSAMSAAASAALVINKLVLAVGSFRAEDQRRRFRDIATSAGAGVTILRMISPIETAAERIRSRIAQGERGPTEGGIRRIDVELRRAEDIDAALTNDTSIEHLHRRVDAMMEFLMRNSDHDAALAAVLVERFEELAAYDVALTRELIETKRFHMAPSSRDEEAAIVDQQLQRSGDRIRELRGCLILGLPRPIEMHIEDALQKAADRWVEPVDRLKTI